MDYYKDDPPRRPSRYRDDDYFDGGREPFEDFDREPYPPGGDPYRMFPPHPPPDPRDPRDPRDHPAESFVMCGMVAVEFKNPFDPKPNRRSKPGKCHTVFVGSLPDNCNEVHLKDLFSGCGSIVETRVSRGRNFGHIQFTLESMVERAMELSGCTIRIKNSYSPKDTAKIHVDYAQDKSESDFKKKIQEEEILPYNQTNVSTITTEIHGEDCFKFAAKNVIYWLTRSQLDDAATVPMYGLVNAVNTHARKVNKLIQTHDEEAFEYNMKRKVALQKILSDSEVMVEVYESALGGKMWSSFTKPQRKAINQWKEQAVELRERLKAKIEDEDEKDRDEPPRKVAKASDDDTNLEADLDRAKKEIEQLKTDREVAIEKKDKQILQLKTLMAKFKKTCPEEWDKALGVTSETKKSSSDKNVDKLSADMAEVIDGVSLDDLNTVIDKDASENSLASAAAAYAQMRKSVGSSDTSGLGLSEAEVAIVTVLAAYLTVHPLGATIEAITSYFQTFNPSYNTYYLESLLRRLTKVFQLSGEGSGKWWFLGFQTCYATPTAAENHET